MYQEWLKNLVETLPYGDKGKLAGAMGIDGTILSRILAGQRQLKIEEIEAAAEYFGVNFPLKNAANARIGHKIPTSSQFLPVFGQAVGGTDGDFIMNGVQIAELAWPPRLSKDAYAVQVYGDSMEPRFAAGETLVIDPARQIKKGDYVVAQIVDRDNTEAPPLAFVKRFVRWNSKELILEQFNPQGELKFPSGDVKTVHYVAMAGPC